mmetsp:Transcript_30065/g.67813  ORF Transcript_30065/g.67813 Transcript_30065/m.67813 type:complete len:430 (-) Transcript_30065:56-1345(-)
MRVSSRLLLSACGITATLAFSFKPTPYGSINLSSSVDRDVYTMADWASAYGVQQVEGLQLTSYDGKDYFPMTQSDIPQGSPVMFIPSDLIFTSSKAQQEFGDSLYTCEQKLIGAGLEDKLPLFRVFFKILSEFQMGENSPWYSWLNSLPRIYNTGASMTYACFDCLPPYAAYCAFSERQNFVNFQKSVRPLPNQYAPFSDEVGDNVTVLKWAYNVALTRSIEVDGERFIAPLADMFNHAAQTNVEISYDGEGNCNVYATSDIPAGSELSVSYGDPTDPTPLFAKYGFLDESSPGTFCKLMKHRTEMEDMGYTFGNLLFYRDSGEVSPEVYDVILYQILKENDPSQAQEFYQSVMNGDEQTKNSYVENYWSYIKEELQKHVDGTLRDLDKWSSKASSYDINTHPRVPLILQHNSFVKETFTRVKNNLDYM